MSVRWSIPVIVLAVSCGSPGAVAADVPPEAASWEQCLRHDPDTGEPRIDAACFFDLLVERYHRIAAYEDIARVVHVTEREGSTPKRIETRIGCEIEDGQLRVETPAAQVRRSMGLDVGYSKTPATEAAALRYKIWLAPHMALRFAEEPTRAFRAGGEDALAVADAETVSIDDRELVHLELRSGDGQGDGCDATLDLYVNPASMLVERVQGQQRLPGGGSYETTLEITPVYVESVPAATLEAEAAPAPVAAPPAVPPGSGAPPPSAEPPPAPEPPAGNTPPAS